MLGFCPNLSAPFLTLQCELQPQHQHVCTASAVAHWDTSSHNHQNLPHCPCNRRSTCCKSNSRFSIFLAFHPQAITIAYSSVSEHGMAPRPIVFLASNQCEIAQFLSFPIRINNTLSRNYRVLGGNDARQSSHCNWLAAMPNFWGHSRQWFFTKLGATTH